VDGTAGAEFFAALADLDGSRAVGIALGLLEAGVPASVVLLDLVAPALRRAGLRWQDGTWSTAREHAATCLVEEVVGAVGERSPGDGSRGRVVLGCPAGEWHALPAMIAAEVLRQHGWRVGFLGPSAPAAGFVARLHDEDPDVVAVSCTAAVHLPEAHRVITAVRRAGGRVLAGGAGFGADGRWGRRLGADAVAATAADAVAVLAAGRWEGGTRAVTDTGGVEHACLRQRRTALVGRVEAVLPADAARAADPLGSPAATAAHLVDVLGAAVYVRDPEVFAEGVRWLDALLEGRTGSRDGVRDVLGALAADLHDFPAAQHCLARGRARLTPL
jgi:methanogenic corrinoid protein MtbC1